eukprot:GFKZ01006476.1.p1 GENE.GFKZ01006476.1~~GFKZ01006476.1.p1  ORF type:complete len:982 (-),score=145.33 GFKZ01006476.1:157-3102(-)
MNTGRWNTLTVEEPNAFRIARPPPTFDLPSSSSPRDGNHAFSSDYAQSSHSNYSRVPQDFSSTPSHPFEPASWLASADFSSPSFSAHDFLQRVLSPEYDKASRPTQIPVLDDAFDADAALAALDTVESALRKKRQAARREEEVARDELRKALHLSAKKRDNLLHTADTVSANIATFSSIGKQAAGQLSADAGVLKALADKLSSLQNARDLVSLLAVNGNELDAVRVSKLLSSARKHIEDGSLASLLSPDDMAVARQETERCEKELVTSIHDWMRVAVDSGNNQVVRDCAQAAEELNVCQQFIDSYISHTLSFEDGSPKHTNQAHELDSLQPDAAVAQFQVVCWETSSSIGEIIPTVCDSFSKPARPMASVLRVLSERKVIPTAEAILTLFLNRSEGETTIAGRRFRDISSSDAVYPPIGRSSMERMKSLAISDGKENWRETTRRAAIERKKFLMVSTDIFKSIQKLKVDMLGKCRERCGGDVEVLFTTGADPYSSFARRMIPEYLRSERAWLDQQFGTAFFDITRIEAHVPRLAPRQTSDADVYHRYRAFYSRISSQYCDMTKSAIQSTYESLCRVATLLMNAADRGVKNCQEVSPQKSSNLSSSNCNPSDRSSALGPESPLQKKSSPLSKEALQSEADKRFSMEEICQYRKRTCDANDPNQILREFLNGLLMSYLANTETILQAATHLLPISEADAQMVELWASGASPLAAYMQAVDILARSNGLVDEFLRTLELPCHFLEDRSPTQSFCTDLSILAPQETRDLLHRELTTGLIDLGIEAQVGVKAAVAAVRARLSAMLSEPSAKLTYRSPDNVLTMVSANAQSISSKAGLELDVSPVFMSASTFIEQQLQSVLSSVQGCNREFVISELSITTKEAVLQCWCDCDGPISVAGALQLVSDGRAMMRVFQNHRESASTMECLPAVGQLFLESTDGLWKCVESSSLANVDAKTLIELLKKRDDIHLERVIKVCQSLGASVEDL